MNKTAMTKYCWKVLAVLLVVLGLGFAYYYTPIDELLTQEGIQSLVDQYGVFGPVVFGLLYFVLTLALLPASVFTVLAGVVFGKFLGTVIVVIAATVAATVAFLIARWLGQDAVSKFAGGSGTLSKWIGKIEKGVEENGFQFLFIMRCLFLPYMPVSYAAGLVRSATLRDFFLSTLITNCIFSFMFVYLGDNLLKGPKALILPVIMVVIALQIPKIIKKFKKDKSLDSLDK